MKSNTIPGQYRTGLVNSCFHALALVFIGCVLCSIETCRIFVALCSVFLTGGLWKSLRRVQGNLWFPNVLVWRHEHNRMSLCPLRSCSDTFANVSGERDFFFVFVFFNSCKYKFLFFFWELCLVGASTYIFFIEIYTRSLHMKWEFNVFLYSGFTPPGVFLVIHVYRWRFTDLIRPMWNQCVSPLEAEVVFDLGFVGVSVGVGCIEKAGCIWWEMFVRFFFFFSMTVP